MTIFDTIIKCTEIGVQAIPISPDASVTQYLNPWYIFNEICTVTFALNACVAYESAHFNEGKHARFRRDFQTRPGMAAFTGYEGDREMRIIFDNRSGKIKLDETMERDKLMTATTFWLFIPTILIASNRNIRSKFIAEMSTFGHIPKFMSEILKRTRSSTCGLVTVVPAIQTIACNVFLDLNPQFRGTVADPNFLYTEEGLNQFMDQLHYVYNHSGNYIPFVPLTKFSAPQLESGNQTTFGALISVIQRKTITIYVNLANSYRGGTPDRTHVFDCCLLMPSTNDPDYDKSLVYSHAGVSFPFPSSERLMSYLVRRVLGIDLVDRTTSTASVEPSGTPASSSSASASRAATRGIPQSPLRSRNGKRIWLTPEDFSALKRLSRLFSK